MGSEIFNNHLVRFWGEAVTGLTLNRSRPYQKNDHRFVEQKNATLAHQDFGTIRLDPSKPFKAMNIFYDTFFQLVMHLPEKRCQGEHTVIHWDQAQTPSQRLVATGTLSSDQQVRLQALYQQTNPHGSAQSDLSFVRSSVGHTRHGHQSRFNCSVAPRTHFHVT